MIKKLAHEMIDYFKDSKTVSCEIDKDNTFIVTVKNHSQTRTTLKSDVFYEDLKRDFEILKEFWSEPCSGF